MSIVSIFKLNLNALLHFNYFVSFIEQLTDNVEKLESIITSKKVQLENTEEMLSFSKVNFNNV